MVQSFSDLWEVLRAWIQCFFDTFKVFLSVFEMIALPGTFTSFSDWMPSLFFSVMSLMVALLIVLRIVGR